MTTTLHTQLTKAGIELSNDDGTVHYIIGYQFDPRLWQVSRPDGEQVGPAWITREAAEFYALALHVDAKEDERLAA